MPGKNERRRTGASVGVNELAASLDEWTDESASHRHDLGTYLSEQFPQATIDDETGSAASLVVDDVAIRIVDDVDSAVEADLTVLLEEYDGVCCLPQDHQPDAWDQLVEAYADEAIRFVEESATSREQPTISARTATAAIPLAMLGIAGALALTMGVFSTGETALLAQMWGMGQPVVGGFALAGSLVVSVGTIFAVFVTWLGLFGVVHQRCSDDSVFG